MKFPRNARILRGQLDFTPFAAVLFLVVIFVLLGGLIYTPGVRIQLPAGDDLAGTDQSTIAVAVDAGGRFYFRNQNVTAAELTAQLRDAVSQAGRPLTLVLQADKAVTQETLIEVTLLARDAGIRDALLATLPRLLDEPPPPATTP